MTNKFAHLPRRQRSTIGHQCVWGYQECVGCVIQIGTDEQMMCLCRFQKAVGTLIIEQMLLMHRAVRWEDAFKLLVLASLGLWTEVDRIDGTLLC